MITITLPEWISYVFLALAVLYGVDCVMSVILYRNRVKLIRALEEYAAAKNKPTGNEDNR